MWSCTKIDKIYSPTNISAFTDMNLSNAFQNDPNLTFLVILIPPPKKTPTITGVNLNISQQINKWI